MAAHEPRQVLLLFGSPSVERRVSVASAQYIADCVAARLWFWTPDDRVIEVSRQELLGHSEPFTRDFQPRGEASHGRLEVALESLDPEQTLVLIGAHGGAGEDGRLQHQLEALGLAYTGSDSRASALAFDKSTAADIAQQAGLRVPKAAVLRADTTAAAHEAIATAHATLGPLIVKAESGGSSLQLCFVEGSQDFAQAASLLVEEPGLAFRAEEIIRGREFTVGIADHGGTLVALPCSEVVTQQGRSFDYNGKYLGDGTEEITPARIPHALASELQHRALDIHRALECFGYSRSDFMVDGQGPAFLETNTLPGLTLQSFIPQQLEAAGIPFAQFVQEQCELAWQRRLRLGGARPKA